MAIDHVSAVVPVADIDTARGWYERLLGREADNRPMDSLAEWRVTDTGWLQVSHDADRAGTALVNFAVDELAAHLESLQGRGLAPGAIQTVNKGVQLSAITDPDGNKITFIGSFRINYCGLPDRRKRGRRGDRREDRQPGRATFPPWIRPRFQRYRRWRTSTVTT